MPPGRSRDAFEISPPPDTSYGVFLYGPSRPVVLRAAYAFARANDSNPYWVTVRDPPDRPDSGGPVELGWIPSDHLFVISKAEAQPQDAVSNLALWTVVRSDEPQSVIAGLSDFLRLPPSVQEALSVYGQEHRRPVFVVANTDRVRDSYPRDRVGVRAIVDAMLSSGVTPVFAAVGPAGPGRAAFDLVLEVDAPDLGHWKNGHLRCERAYDGAALHADERIPMESIPRLAAALEGRKD